MCFKRPLSKASHLYMFNGIAMGYVMCELSLMNSESKGSRCGCSGFPLMVSLFSPCFSAVTRSLSTYSALFVRGRNTGRLSVNHHWRTLPAHLEVCEEPHYIKPFISNSTPCCNVYMFLTV